MTKKTSTRKSMKKSMKKTKKSTMKVSKSSKISKRKSFRKAKKPLSPECQKMFNIRKRYNLKAFKEGTVFQSGFKYHSEKDAISAAFNQLRRAKPDCFE